MATKTTAERVAQFRKIAEDTTLPRDVRNEYLDKANALEKEAAKPTMARGGDVKAPKKQTHASILSSLPPGRPGPAMAKGGVVKAPAKKPMAKKPAVAIMIAVGKPKEKMAKGGVAKKGSK